LSDCLREGENVSKSLYVAVALVLLQSIAYSQDKPNPDANSGMVYGDNHAFILTAPKGWILDNESGRGQGLHAVFYPEGSSWQKGDVVMYAGVQMKKDTKESLDRVIERDIAEHKKRSEQLRVEDGEPIPVKTKEKTATIKYFSGDAWGNSEAVGYIDESKVVVVIVLTSRTRKEFDAALPAFSELVRSYFFVADKAIFQEMKKRG
jgi:hypothetical protein